MEANDRLKQIALEVFGTSDGIRPKFPKTGEKIQEAMEASFKAGQESRNTEIRELRIEVGSIAFTKGKKAGIREVVEKIEPILLGETTTMGRKLIQITNAIAKLKESGADNELQD